MTNFLEVLTRVQALILWAQKYVADRRHRRLVNVYDFPSHGTFLDVSCGNGACLNTVHSHFPSLDIHGVDISESAIAKAREICPWARLSVSDARALLYSADTFDVVLSCMSLHHYKEPRDVFADIARVLKASGKLYVSDIVPRNRLIQRLFNFDGCSEPYHFERYYTEDEIKRLGMDAGLSCIDVRNGSWFSGVKILVLQKPHAHQS